MFKYVLLFTLSIFYSNIYSQNSVDSEPIVIPLWEGGAPGFELLKDEPEAAKDWWVKNIHNPSITVFRPASPNGAMVLICPGGGHKENVFHEEGTKTARFFNKMGVTAAVLKYRLYREENSPYTSEHPKQDVIRAMRLIRNHTDRWQIDPDRVGIMGFSAGGEVVNMIAFENNPAFQYSSDTVEQNHANPNFIIHIYPGPDNVPETVEESAVPAFLLASSNDNCCSQPILDLLIAYRQAGAEVEAHFYAKDEHGFNMGDRSNFDSIKHWPQRLADWMKDYNYFE